MIGKALDKNNDIIFESKGFKLVSDGANVVQNVKTNLQTFESEWFLNRNFGTPYFREILIKPANLERVESELKLVILNTEGINKLVSFSMEYLRDIRKLNVNYEAETIYGSIIGETVNV